MLALLAAVDVGAGVLLIVGILSGFAWHLGLGRRLQLRADLAERRNVARFSRRRTPA